MPVGAEVVEVAAQGVSVLERVLALGSAGVLAAMLAIEKFEKREMRREFQGVIEKKDAALDAMNAWMRGAFDEMRRRRENNGG